MSGNIDLEGVIPDLLVNEFGANEVYTSGYSFDDAIYSDGFIYAVESGLIPDFHSIQESFLPKKDKEYHHVILNDECYIMYFN